MGGTMQPLPRKGTQVEIPLCILRGITQHKQLPLYVVVLVYPPASGFSLSLLKRSRTRTSLCGTMRQTPAGDLTALLCPRSE